MLTIIEWIVVVFASLSLLKIVVLAVDKQSWWPVTRTVYGHKFLSGIIFLILAGYILYYLLMEISIVHVLASAAFVSLIIGIGFLQYSNELMKLAKNVLKKGLSFWTWTYIGLWTLLLLWGLIEIFK